MAATSVPVSAAARENARRETNRKIRSWVGRIIAYTVLTVCAYLMLFPFIYMFTTSLKQSTDVLRYPPRLLPYSQENTEINGETVPLYNLEVDGVARTMYPTGETVPFGFFTTEADMNPAEPERSANLRQIPIEEAVETERTVTIGDEEFDVYQVTADGQTQELLLAYRRGLNQFADISDPAITTYAVERTAPAQEYIEPQFGNYNVVLEGENLSRALVNTTVVTVLVTLGQVSTSLLGGYAFSRIRFPGRNALFLMYLGTIMIPFVVLIIPLYQLMVLIGWQDRLVSLILPWIFTAYGTFLMRQFFISIPKDLEEAAMLDGTTRFGILWRVFVPLSGPAIATQVIITFLYAWNSFLWPLVIIGEGNTQNHVLTLAVRQLLNNYANQPNIVLTGAAIAVIPPLIVFILAQRYFIEGIANTGLK